MKIAILGGSFDPPHIGHLLVAQQVKKLLNIDAVWLMPAFSHPFQKDMTPAKHRLAMTKFLEDTTIKASDFEITKKGVSYTIDTLKSLHHQFPNDTFFWIIGSDQIETFAKWKNWQEIISQYKIIMYARNQPQQTIEQKIHDALGIQTIPSSIYILNTNDLLTSDASSTEIRQRVKNRQSIRGLVPKQVETYIIEHKLYE